MSRAVGESNRRLLRARDTMDRDYAKPLDVAALARGPVADVLTCFAMAWLRPRG
ncbi:hypothetical protein VA596_15185 [Amycolatopsis sp., V23-08]|uniref:Uncharacterized protein n=1 Tax=Amycolatopsis heterodermiae TaxID=3110235 RepID=A0ABU5R4W0_9PSEU|nr:hypothetical protein [Amycolatopsis sp., V23-08]MEA5360890.1 hypothetical protein [Amycolatopsis sp., V23-08]